MIKGQVISGEYGKILIRQKANEKIELGELLVGETKDARILMQAINLLYGSQISQQNLELISGMSLEDNEKINFMDADPDRLKEILSKRLHMDISVNKKNLNEFREVTKGIKLIRSVELVAIAYELGLLDKYLVNIPDAKRTLLEAVLWGVKLNGCSVSDKEIEEIIRMEVR